MSFPELLAHIENSGTLLVGLDEHVVPFILTNSSQDKIYFASVKLDTEISLGHLKLYREPGGPYAESLWVAEIRYAKSLNVCWRRFVCCKELMHLYDEPEARANTAERFETLLSELELAPPISSEMLKSENAAIWKAMAVLAPKHLRDELAPRYASGALSSYELALKLRIPEFYVTHVMHRNFDAVIREMTGGVISSPPEVSK